MEGYRSKLPFFGSLYGEPGEGVIRPNDISVFDPPVLVHPDLDRTRSNGNSIY